MFRIRIENWVNGQLNVDEKQIGDFHSALTILNAHHSHHRHHSHGHTIKIYNDAGEIVHSVVGAPPATTDTSNYSGSYA